MADLHALLVGIDRYRPQRIRGLGLISDLQGSVYDAERMERFLLEGPLAVPAERIRVLTSPSLRPGRSPVPDEGLPTYRNLVREIQALAERARPGDQVLIHYSGHGVSLPTAVPENKGTGGRDESLVPCDAAAPAEEGGGFLRDVELHALLQGLAEQGLRVTLVLDSCHSGGATRAVERGRVRGLGHLDLAPGAASPLGSWEELGARLPTRETFRNLDGAAGWFPQPEGCVLLAACLSTEYAREYPFADGRWSGALTHFFLEAAGELGPRPTYRWLHGRLLGRIHGLFAQQTPVLEGDGDLAVLGRERWPGRPGIPVLEVADGARGRRILLGAGRAQGLGVGARLEVRNPGGAGGEGEVALEVLSCEAISAWAVKTSSGSPGPGVAAGDLAVVVDPGEDARRYRVATVHEAGGEPLHRDALGRLTGAMAAGERPLLVPAAADGGDLQVEVMPAGAFRILDPSGEPIPHQGEAILVGTPEAEARLLDRLEHLARFRAVQDLDNPDSGSPLFGRLCAELFALERMEDWNDPAERVAVDGRAVPVGTLLCLLVRNESRRELNVVVLDLQPDWGVSRAHPNRNEGDYATLPAGAEHPVFLRAGLPDWMNEGRDHLKIIAAAGPLDAAHLELPALGESVGYRSFRTGASEPSLRNLLLAPPRGGFRTMESISPASYDWAVETVQVGVKKVNCDASQSRTQTGGLDRSCPEAV